MRTLALVGFCFVGSHWDPWPKWVSVLKDPSGALLCEISVRSCFVGYQWDPCFVGSQWDRWPPWVFVLRDPSEIPVDPSVILFCGIPLGSLFCEIPVGPLTLVGFCLVGPQRDPSL